jgi:hypothetical protein
VQRERRIRNVQLRSEHRLEALLTTPTKAEASFPMHAVDRSERAAALRSKDQTRVVRRKRLEAQRATAVEEPGDVFAACVVGRALVRGPGA